MNYAQGIFSSLFLIEFLSFADVGNAYNLYQCYYCDNTYESVVTAVDQARCTDLFGYDWGAYDKQRESVGVLDCKACSKHRATDENGKELVVRGCETVARTPGCEALPLKDVPGEICYCHGDLCNPAAALRAPPSPAALGLLLGAVVALRRLL